MDFARNELHLVVVHHRDRTVKAVFSNPTRAHEWVRERRRVAPVVQYSVESVWLRE